MNFSVAIDLDRIDVFEIAIVGDDHCITQLQSFEHWAGPIAGCNVGSY